MFIRKRAWGAAAAVAVAAMVSGCAGGAGDVSSDPVEGGDLVFAIADDIGCVDMRQTTYRSLLHLARQTTDSLVYMGTDGEATPWLAESWDINDDASEFTFHLRDDVVFSDGTPFTAETVRLNLDQLVEQGPTAQLAASYITPTYVETEVVDDHTAKVVFSAPNAPFLYAISTPNLGMYSDPSTELSVDELCQGEFSTSGAYLLDDYLQNEQTVLVRNEEYAWGPSALENSAAGSFDTITFPVITDPSVVAGSALAGDIDLALGTSSDDTERLNEGGWYQNDDPDAALAASWMVRFGNGIAGEDEAVRDAITIGIDREALMAVGSSQQQAATSVLNAAHPYYTDQSDQLVYDPVAAAEILDAAGWEPGEDGIREKDGEKLVVDSIFYVENAQPILELAQQQLREIGIDFRLERVTGADSTARRVEGDFEIRHDWYTGPEPLVIANATAELNRPEELEELIAAQAAETDVAARQEIVAEINDLVVDLGILIPIYTQNATPFIGPTVTERVQDVGGLLMLTQMQLVE